MRYQRPLASILLFSLVLCFGHCLWSQSFNKGYSTGDAGIGFVVFNNSATPQSTGVRESDTTGASIFPFDFEYGFLPWLGGGGMFRFYNYIEGDSSNAQATGLDLSFRMNLHAVRSKRWNIFTGVTFGYSRVRYFVNDAFGSEVTGGGTNAGLNACVRFYFSEYFGMYLNGGYIHRDFPSLLGSNSFTQEKYHYQESGYEVGVGIQISIRPRE